ncbi:RRP12-like protein, partial [Trichonephila clavata]
LQRNWNPRSLLHKEMIAVIAAVAEILKNNEEEETEANYFAALMTTLDVVDTDESVTAVVCLLAMIAKRMNESILKSQSKKVIETIAKLLIKYMNSDHCALLRNLLTIVYSFMKVKTQWTESTDELKIVLEFTTHHKAKVRKVAQQVIKSLLRNYKTESSTTHPCTNLIAKFCIEKLGSAAGLGKSKSKDIFYMLQLIQEIISVFPTSSIKKCCETIFKIMTLSNSMVTLCGFKSLHGLFYSNNVNLPSDLNARIITALYDYQPHIKDSENLILWIQLMGKALMNLYSLDEKLGISHLPQFFSVAIKCLLNDTENVMMTVRTTLIFLLQNCFETINEESFDDHKKTAIYKMFHSVEEALGYQYHKAWGHVLLILGGFFEVVGKYCKDVMKKCLKSLGDLHDSYNFPYIPALEKALGIAIEHMGPRIVLEAIPLQFDGEKPDFPMSWMLPLLRNHVKRTELKFFFDYFLKLAIKIRSKILVLEQEKKPVESKLFEVVSSQIWSLLPGFCKEPTDLKSCFKEYARTLGEVIKTDPSLRLTVLNALRQLIRNDENKEELAKYAKNYLPILFNLYLTESKTKAEEAIRLAVFETCKCYLCITDKQLVSTFFEKAIEKVRSAEFGIFIQQASIDLCKAMVFCIQKDQLQELYEICKSLLKDPNHTTKKKAYSVIKDICSSESEVCQGFVKENMKDLRLLLSETVSGLTPATRALRLNCLENIVSQSTEDVKSAILDITPEAVLCTKENSIKARAAAYELLVAIGHAMLRMSSNSKEGMKEYITCLLAGLAGSPHYVSASILSIGRVIYEFKDELNSDIIDNLINIIGELLLVKSREIVTSALSFFKILFAVLDTDALAQHVQPMITSLTSIPEVHQRSFRFKTKEIFIKLVRKFGYEMIFKMMPENYHKQLQNIRKTEARKKRKKNMINEDSESDSELHMPSKKTDDISDLLADSDDDLPDDEVPEKTQKSRRKKFLAPRLEEKAEDDIVDLLDPAVNKRLLTVRAENKSQPKKRSDDFLISEDGRLIIEDEEEKTESNDKGEKDEKTEVLQELGISVKKNKRKFKGEDDEDDHEVEAGSLSQVHKGIHRTLEPKAKRRRPGEEYKAKKAGGDVKKGKFDPYAYIPFNKQLLNRRKQIKVKGQFKSIVRAAKKGAVTGMKRKSREAKRKKNH